MLSFIERILMICLESDCLCIGTFFSNLFISAAFSYGIVLKAKKSGSSVEYDEKLMYIMIDQFVGAKAALIFRILFFW